MSYSRFSEQDSSNISMDHGIAKVKLTRDGFLINSFVGGGRRVVGKYSNSEHTEATVTVTAFSLADDNAWNCSLEDDTPVETTARIVDEMIDIGPYHIVWCEPGHVWREGMIVFIGGPIDPD